MATYKPLSTDFKDDILASQNSKRKYTQVNNADGTVSFQDSTAYSQVGSSYGAKEVNEEREAINNVYANKLVSLDEIDLVTEEGYFVDAKAVKELNSKIDYTFEQANPSTHPILNGYQLSRVGRLITFSVTDYKKVAGRIEGQKVGQIPSEIAPPIALAVPFSTTGAVTKTESNPGSRLIIGTDGAVSIDCNYDSGNYASWSCTWVI